ncbi:MAG: translocation/assembly module TamB domain-containing protein [Pseudomonadota bacterium]
MAAPTAPACAPGPARAARRWPRRLLGTLVVLGALLGGAWWWLGREATLQTLVQKLADLSGGHVDVDGVSGSMVGAMHFGHIAYRGPSRTVTLENVEVRWSPWQILSSGIAVSELRADVLHIAVTGPSASAPALPETLAPPFRITLSQASVKRLTISAGGADTVIDNLRFKLAGDDAKWELREASATTAWGLASAQARIGSTSPFSVDASASLTLAGKAPAQLAVRAGGTLAALSVSASGHAGPAKGTAALAFTPFEAVPLRTLALHASGIDPSYYGAALPHADLALELSASVDAREHLEGKLALSNAAGAGTLDQRRLPLRAIHAELSGALKALQLARIEVDLGAAGKLDGGAQLSSDAQEGSPLRAELTLRTERIDLKAIHARLHSTRIGGALKFASIAGKHTLGVELAQDGLRIEAQAGIGAGLLTLERARLASGAASALLRGQIALAAPHAFKVEASTAHLNPQALGDYPPADISAQLNAHGTLAPALQMQADLTVAPSTFMRQPLSGKGSFHADVHRVSAVAAAFAFGPNTVELHGGFGGAGETLAWRIDAPQLAALDAGLAGNAHARGTVSGSVAAPRSSFELDAAGLGWKAPARSGADGALHASGEAWLTPQRAFAFKLSGGALRINPAAFGAPLAGSVNAAFDADGQSGADWHGALTLQPSTLAAAPLSGYAKLSYGAAHTGKADIDLHLGQNSVSARGGFGADSERLDWRVDANTLAALGPQFGGTLRGSGSFSGTFETPTLSGTLDAHDLALHAHHARTLRANVKLGGGHGGADALVTDIDIDGYSGVSGALASAHLQTRGTRAAHTLHAQLRNDDYDAVLDASGAFKADSWSGTVGTLQNRGRLYPFTLQSPLALRLAAASGAGLAGLARPQQISLGAANIKLPEGTVKLASFDKNGAHWNTRGSATGVPLTYLEQFSSALRDSVSGDLTLGAGWSIDLDAPAGGASTPAVAGMLRLVREGGDVVVGAEVPVPLGLRLFDARAEVVGGALRVQVEMDGSRAGHAHFDANAKLVNGHLETGSALTLNASANMASVAWLAPLSGEPGLELDGALQLVLNGTGTFGAPVLNGSMNGDQLALRWTEQGVKLRNGVLRAQLAGDQLLLQRLAFDGPQGHALADGAVRFAGGEASAQFKLGFDKLEILARPDRTLVVSGQSTLTRDASRFALEGKLLAERALFELAPLDRPTLSDDVIVLSKAGAPLKPASKSRPLTVDLDIDLGPQFQLKGMGLDAQLAGTLHLHGADRRPPRAVGGIRVVTGTYAAYGQRLQIERGQLNFSGALDNPALNILALRKRPDGEALSETNVEAGVEVRGSALAPSAKLVSTPAVPNSEKLAWLVLGHGIETAAGQEFGVYSAAVGALLGAGGNGVQSRLASTIGVDELGLAQARGVETTVVTVGKRLSQRAYLSFEQGASSATSLVKLRYQLNPRVTVQLQTGANSALDLLYSWSFD